MSESKAALQARIAELEAENSRQKKIIDALVRRAEQGGCGQVDAWGAFQHSVVLADQVREKTEELNQALHSIESANRELMLAKQQAEQAHQRFIDAIESITDALPCLTLTASWCIPTAVSSVTGVTTTCRWLLPP